MAILFFGSSAIMVLVIIIHIFMLSKKQLTLKNLQATYCRLQPSPLGGVGIFAIRSIPKNTNIFQGAAKQAWFKFNKKDLQLLDKDIKRLVADFFGSEDDDSVYVPQGALNNMNISFYLNHSDQPNVKTIDQGQTFITLRKIKKGEELYSDYRTYDPDYKF